MLRRRAAESHQSLQEYLLSRLVEEASRPTVDEVLARAGGRAVAGGALPVRRAELALRDLLDLPLERVAHRPLALRRWELRDNLTV